MKRTILLVGLLVVLGVCAAETNAAKDTIACEGAYKGHLQGVATDGNAIFWSFTVKLVKTGLDGRVQAAVDVPNHHGDLCVKDGVVYVAVNLGRFNGENLGVSEVWAYAADDLRKVGRWTLPDCKYGAGGLTVADDRFFVIGGLPATHECNVVYEYTSDFTLVKRHELKTGYTLMGIQTAAYEDGRFIFGIYGSAGNPSGSLECPRDLSSFTRRLGPGDVGVLKLDGDYWTGRAKGYGGVLVRSPGYPASESAYAPKRTGKGAYKVFRGGDPGWTDSGYRLQSDGYRPLFRTDPESPNGVFFPKARLNETNAVLPAVEVGGEFRFSAPDLVRAVRRVAETDEAFAVHLNSSAADVKEALAAMRAEADGLGVRVLEPTSAEIVATDLWRIAGDFGSVEGSVVCETNGFSVESHGCRVEMRTTDSAQGVTARQTVVRNVGATSVALTDLLDRWTFEGDDWEVYTQSNDWQLESIGNWEPVEGVVEHRAGGMRTCDGATPMMTVWNRRTNEGRVFHAVSDGMWFFRAERLSAGLRVEVGYDPRHLRWTLAPGEQVALPEILTYETANRLDFDCHKLHAYWNARHPAREKKLPAIYNTWLCRFDKLDLDFLLKQVARTKEIGFDYFVVDAGWFGPKASWGSVRGDWEERPDGWLGGRLGEVSKAVREAGMKFGFWVEPECASAGARVVKEHPDWFFKAGGYFLDFRKPEAFDGLLETVCALVKRYEASFLKFDFNQTAAKDESGRDWADYNAAYQRFVEQVRARNPGIRIEGCASGGYMMDLSWSRSFDGFWLSDDQSLYDGVRIAKDTMLRLPPRCIERWLTLTRARGVQPDYDGHDSRLLTTEDATWTNVRSVPLSRVEGFVAGGPFCMSCDLTTFDAGDVARFREVIAKTRADSAFWQRAVGRILVDTPEATVLQYSDEKLFDVRLFAISHGTRAQRLTVRPALDAQAAYRVNGRERAATALAESGLAVTAPACGGACEMRLRKVHPQGAVRRPGGFHAPALRKHLGIPSVAVSPVNGRLWCVYYCGKTPGEDLNSYVVLSTSGDGGRTWKEVLVADTDEDGPFRTFDSELWVAPDGKLRWTWTERLCRLYEGDPSAPYGLDEGDSATDRLMMATLSAEEEPDEPPRAVQVGAGVMMCKPFVLADGAWMLPVAHWREAPSTCFYASTDGGKDFSRRGGVTIPEKMRLYDEPCAAQLRTGEILTFIRTGGEASHPLEALSSDGGKTWTEPRPARFAHTSSRVFLRRLASGNLLLVKNGPLDRDVGRRELTAFLSRDDGKTWEGGLVLDARANVSYPDGDQRADGTIVVVHDRDRLGAMEVLLSEFTEEDVLEKSGVRRRRVFSRPQKGSL